MKNPSIFLVVCLAIILLSGCAPEPEPTNEEIPNVEADIEALKARLKAWDVAYNVGDVDTVVSFFTDDAVRMQADAPAWIGKPAIRAGFEKQFEENTFESNNVNEGVVVSGDWAITRGTWTVSLTPKGEGEPIQSTGNAMALSQRQPDGSWRIVWNIWNRDTPLPQPE